MNYLPVILQALQNIKANGPESNYIGICSNLENKIDNLVGTNNFLPTEWLQEKFEIWPKFSGNSSYPIKLGDECPIITYIDCNGSYWNKRNKYGKLRHELLDFLIKQAILDIEAGIEVTE